MTQAPQRRTRIVWQAGWSCLGIWLCWLLSGSPVWAVIGGCAGCGVATILARRREGLASRRHAEAMTSALPDALELLAATVDGGAAPELAVIRVAAFSPEPLRSALVKAASRTDGTGLGAAIRTVDPTLRPLGSLFQQSEELGVPIAKALRLLAADARLQARAHARQRAAAAAPKMLLVIGGLLAPAALLIVIGGQALVLRGLIGPVIA